MGELDDTQSATAAQPRDRVHRAGYYLPMFDREDLLRLANQRMPFGKYRGRRLIDLPEPYLLWFAKEGFPAGKLGELLQLALEIKGNGLTGLLQPLKRDTSTS